MISVIIINYNTESLTRSCIRSVLSISKTNFEIVLVDNSSDQFDEESFRLLDRRIKIIRNKINVGFSKACNIGIENSSGEYVLLLNSDTELLNDALGKCALVLGQNPDIAVVSSKLESPDGKIQHPAERFPSLSREFRELFRINKRLTQSERSYYYLGEEFDHLSSLYCDWVWGAFFMFRRNILSELPDHRLDERFFMYAEDMLWCWQINRLGHSIYYCHEAHVLHYGGGSEKRLYDKNTKYFLKMLPNIFMVVCSMRGHAYAWLLFFVRAIHLISLRNTKDLKNAYKTLKFIFGLNSSSLRIPSK